LKPKKGRQKELWYGKLLQKNLEKMEYPKFKVEQRSVRDRLKKLIKQFRKRKMMKDEPVEFHLN
jgi:hypothetical protein